MYVKDIMKKNVFVLYENSTVSHASEIMKFKNLRHIPIVNKDFVLVGLITHRDLIKALGDSQKLIINDFMRKEIITVTPETPLKGAIDVMLNNKYGCLPVVDRDRKLIGIITETDLLKALYEFSHLPSEFYIEKK